jgi:branched-chain amino acid transport system permease protein
MSSATGVYSTSYRQDLRIRRTRLEHARLALVFAAVAAAPFLASPYWLNTLDQIGIAVIGAVGLNILVGFTGQISLGQAGFLAVGAYTAAVCTTKYAVNPVVGVGVAALTSALAGAFIGLPALRLKGLYLAIATLASQQIIDPYLVSNWSFLNTTSGLVSAGGLHIAKPFGVFGWHIHGESGVSFDRQWYFVIAAFAIVTVVLARNLFRTGVGRAFVAIRDQEVAAEAIGVDTARYKILAFALSSGIAGVAGALTAYWQGTAVPDAFTINLSILYLAMIIVGGLGSISGSVYGAILIVALPAWLSQLGEQLSSLRFLENNLPAIQQVIFGLTIILFLIFEPKGLARLWQRSKDYVRLWPFRY